MTTVIVIMAGMIFFSQMTINIQKNGECDKISYEDLKEDNKLLKEKLGEE